MFERPKRDEEPSLQTAILQAVAYADLFDYPLTAAELHQYLVGTPAPPFVVQSILEEDGLIARRLSCRDGFFTLRGRESIVETRRHRTENAIGMWQRARRYGSVITRLPFVRMVGVTGALAVDNVESDTDIDFLIVTESGRLWLCRAFVVALVRLAAFLGDDLCPNYFLTERALILPERSLFTAHELAQMVPLSGLATYRRMRQLNAWVLDFLPNAFGQTRTGQNSLSLRHKDVAPVFGNWRSARRLSEVALATRGGTWLEHWEMERKIRKFGAQSKTFQAFSSSSEATLREDQEVSFCADRCKGHFQPHGQRILEAFAERLQSLDLPFPAIAASGVSLGSGPGGGCR
ncbi:MAG: hypothetical protein Q7O66_18015 [Dehalococcoidia bacterium]|nr:hypothetical protein [Dehalococcoidia bacterium]